MALTGYELVQADSWDDLARRVLDFPSYLPYGPAWYDDAVGRYYQAMTQGDTAQSDGSGTLSDYRVVQAMSPLQLEQAVMAQSASFVPYGGARYSRRLDRFYQTLVIGATASGGGAGGGSGVESINGQTGVVVLDADDVGALPDTYVPTWASLTGVPATFPATVPVATASAWATGRTITLSGDITGTSPAWTGSANLAFVNTAIGAGVIVNADVNATAAIAATKIAFSGIAGYNGTVVQRLTHDAAGVLTWVADP